MRRGLPVLAFLIVFPIAAQPWQSHEYKFSFDPPDSSWSDTSANRAAVLKDSVVEYSSSSGSRFGVSCFSYRSDEQWLLEAARKTAETTLSQIGAAATRIWLIREMRDYRVRGVPGYRQELCYLYGGQVYFAIVVVLVKNDTHYRLLYSCREDSYAAGFAEYKKIIDSFRISD